ncbi:MAG: response regulator transcription factor [Syntrophomonadaceae bacterium]|nr:response regulator transcription factor [Syntrophomonadaceae bacterium]
MRILVVEDEPALNDVVVKKLQTAHYSVDACFNGNDAVDYMNGAEYDAIVLDIMLPGINGLEFLRWLRSRQDNTPVLLLTARDSIEDRVTGLDAGADDYLVKPFALDELLARIRGIIRRAGHQISNRFTLADLTVDCDTRTVMRGDSPISLSSKEFAILEYMIRNSGIVLSREKIGRHIWNYDYEGGSNVVDVYIRYLRKKIDDAHSRKLIHTVRGAGYVLRDDT